MLGNNNDRLAGQPSPAAPRLDDEGGLRAPPHLHGWRKAWWWFDFIVLVKLARLRFIGILLVIGVVITQWDTLVAHYDKWTRPAQAAESGGAGFEYFCPMHPSIVRDNDKEKCPICFRPLSKRKKGSGEAEALPAGIVNRVQLSPYRVALAGVQTWPVDYEPLVKEITAVGYVEFNERGQRTVSARVAGRIDKLLVNETGRMVEAGDDLALLYSPDLLVTEQNLLAAQRSNNRTLLDSARTRLELLGVGADQIAEILAAGKENVHLRIRSPISGHVITKYVREGQYVQEGTPLYELADLSTVWIQAQVYEDDLAFLPSGYEHGAAAPQAEAVNVTASTRAVPDEVFRGKLAFVYPHADQDTRTVSVRFELDNPGHKLRPGTTATVTFDVQPRALRLFDSQQASDEDRARLAEGQVLAVPEGSVIDTGAQQIVYREASPGVYEGVEVALGPRMARPDGAPFYPVLRGLHRGDHVVTSGSFLVDAETRLNPAAGSIYFGGGGSGAQAGRSSVTAVRPSTPDDPEAKIQASLAALAPEDRQLAAAQRFCPILSGSRLGLMGKPVKLTIDGQTVFLCCELCTKRATANPQTTLDKVRALRAGNPPAEEADRAAPAGDTETEIKATLGSLPPADRGLAEAQRFCAVLGSSRLGSMGAPVRLELNGQPVFLCCKGCEAEARAKPDATRLRAKQLQDAGAATKLR
jgi:multidrug efflux pump subunit AcrA (membrane-fusion protein)